jgi:tetratricopeptide (TPR) repeat protein
MTENLRELELRLEQSGTDAERLTALLELGDILVNTDFVEGWKLSSEAIDLATKLKDRQALAHAHEINGNSLWKLAEFTAAMENLEIALDKYLGLGDLFGVSRCYCGLGVIVGSMEHYTTALDYFEEGLSAARRADRPQMAATITGNIGHVYFQIGRYKEAMECFQHGLEFYKGVSNHHGSGNMLSGMAGIKVYLGEYDEGIELTRRALALHKKAKHQRGIGVTMMNLGIALHKKGKLETAKTELKSALNYARSIDLKMTEHDILKNLSELCSDMGHEDEANEYLRAYIDSQKEEKKQSVARKAEQFRQRQSIRDARSVK